MSEFFYNRQVMVTGGSGFLGRHVVDELKYRRAIVCAPTHSECDLMRQDSIYNYVHSRFFPDILIHLAAKVGGIQANQAKPGEFLYNNMMMGMNVLENARMLGIRKVVIVGTVCSYPKFTKVPFKESDLWNGFPEETNAPYGIAKKALLVQAQAYREQYGMNSVFLMPANMYGPGDNFQDNTSHVIPAMIKRCCLAVSSGKKEIEFWGSGQATRDFLYVSDAVEGILKATELYNEGDPINLGTGVETSIADTSRIILRNIDESQQITSIIWNPLKPDGQPRRCLNVSLSMEKFGFIARTKIEEGLTKTIDWYVKNGKD